MLAAPPSAPPRRSAEHNATGRQQRPPVGAVHARHSKPPRRQGSFTPVLGQVFARRSPPRTATAVDKFRAASLSALILSSAHDTVSMLGSAA